jgi:hypothetical protein
MQHGLIRVAIMCVVDVVNPGKAHPQCKVVRHKMLKKKGTKGMRLKKGPVRVQGIIDGKK